MIELLEATRPDPATGKADPAKLQASYASHPAAVKLGQLVQRQPAPVSIAYTSFRALHAFRFVNAAGEAGQPAEDLLKLPHDHLFEQEDIA